MQLHLLDRNKHTISSTLFPLIWLILPLCPITTALTCFQCGYSQRDHTTTQACLKPSPTDTTIPTCTSTGSCETTISMKRDPGMPPSREIKRDCSTTSAAPCDFSKPPESYSCYCSDGDHCNGAFPLSARYCYICSFIENMTVPITRTADEVSCLVADPRLSKKLCPVTPDFAPLMCVKVSGVLENGYTRAMVRECSSEPKSKQEQCEMIKDYRSSFNPYIKFKEGTACYCDEDSCNKREGWDSFPGGGETGSAYNSQQCSGPLVVIFLNVFLLIYQYRMYVHVVLYT